MADRTEVPAAFSHEMLARAAAPGIIRWLMENFEAADSSYNIPRNVVYEEYRRVFQQQTNFFLNPSTFGKIVRRAFPHLTVRRLGGNATSKYCYTGLIRRSAATQLSSNTTTAHRSISDTPRSTNSAPNMWYESLTRYQPKYIVPGLPIILRNPSLSKDPLTIQFAKMLSEHHRRALDSIINRSPLDEMRKEKQGFYSIISQRFLHLITRPDFLQEMFDYSVNIATVFSSYIIPDPLAEIPLSLIASMRDTLRFKPFERPTWSSHPLYKPFFACVGAVRERMITTAMPRLSLAALAQEIRRLFLSKNSAMTPPSVHLQTIWSKLNLECLRMQIATLCKVETHASNAVVSEGTNAESTLDTTINHVLDSFGRQLGSPFVSPYDWAQWAENALKMLASVGIDWSAFCSLVREEIAVTDSCSVDPNTASTAAHGARQLDTLWRFLERYISFIRFMENIPAVSVPKLTEEPIVVDTTSQGEQAAAPTSENSTHHLVAGNGVISVSVESDCAVTQNTQPESSDHIPLVRSQLPIADEPASPLHFSLFDSLPPSPPLPSTITLPPSPLLPSHIDENLLAM